MANKSLFASLTSRLPRADAVNEAGGRAYKLEPKHALAQVAATGTFGNAFYSTAETQLDEVLKLIDEVDDNQYLAKLALYAREKAFMKDMPAALLVALSVRDTELMHRVFDRVVDNGRVLRTVFQMIRSGQFKNKTGKGRVGLSSSVQRAFQRWMNTVSVGKLLSASIGNDPSLRDILRMARPTPKDNARRAMFGWLTDKSIDKWAPATEADLPVEVQSLIAYRNSESEEAQALIAGGLDNVRWDLLSDAAKGPTVWAALARKMGPQALRMNLNTLLRHDVLGGPIALMPVHILFLELVIDPACSVVFEAEPEDADVMSRPPRNPTLPLFGGRLLGLGLLQGASGLLIVLAIYLSALWGWLNASDATALSFTTLVVANLGLIFANRSWTRTIWATLRTPNAALWWVIGGTTFFLGLALYVPFLRNIFHFSTLHLNDLALCLAGGFLSVIWFEGLKLFKQKWWT